MKLLSLFENTRNNILLINTFSYALFSIRHSPLMDTTQNQTNIADFICRRTAVQNWIQAICQTKMEYIYNSIWPQTAGRNN